MEADLAAMLALALVASDWLIRAVMLVVVPFRRSPDAAKGWLLLILFLPWVGLVIYFLIGRPTMPRWRRERFKRLPDVLATVRSRLGQQLQHIPARTSDSLVPAARLASRLSSFAPLGGNHVDVSADYGETVDLIIADINRAQHHVHLLFYIMTDDLVGQQVMGALQAAVRRGVVCRVLVDGYGSRPWLEHLMPQLAAIGVQAKAALPVRAWNLSGPRMDLRNHRKLAIVDGRIGYTGSQNLAGSGFKKGLNYEELVVRVTGPVVLQLQAVFVADWYLETLELLTDDAVFPAPEVTGEVVAQALPSGPDFPTQNNQRLLVDLLHQAQRRVVITTPYFIPDSALLQALQTAVLRGVDVHLVVAAQIDQWLVGLAQRSYYDELLEMGVYIHHYGEAFLHAKHVTWDDRLVFVGSSNMDIRSFTLNAEISLLFYDAGLVERVRIEQERYFSGSVTLDVKRWRRRSLPVKIVQNLARLLSPLL